MSRKKGRGAEAPEACGLMPTGYAPRPSPENSKDDKEPTIWEALASSRSIRDVPGNRRLDHELVLHEAGDCVPAWPADGDGRIALIICLAARIVKRAGTWHHKMDLAARTMALIDQMDETRALSLLLGEEDPNWVRASPEKAKAIFAGGMVRLGLPIDTPGSSKRIGSYWAIANGLPWGPQEPDDPVIPWLRRVAEVSLDTRRSAVATAELIAEWRAENPDDGRSDRALSMAFAAAITDAWPEEIKRKQVRHSENLYWTSKRGKCGRCRGWIGVRFYSSAPPGREDLQVSAFVPRRGGPRWDA